ncbi:MAG: GNAT family N-acetyltransferase [Lachnospiraceae bacterium]|nr:GNAT family N-acetyltransferase [Lachnospiraceae bacterium]
MKVRLLEDYEKKNIIPLYREVFDDSDDYVRYFYKKVLPESGVFTCTVNGRIVGMLCLIPKRICVGTKIISCYYIYGVATRPDWRRKGVMSHIMKEAVNHLRLHGTSDYFTYLIPNPAGNAAIYEKYGFGGVMDKICVTDKTGGVFCEKHIVKRRAGRSDIACLAEFAAAHVSKSYDVYITRDNSYFENMFSLMEAEGGSIDIYFEEKKSGGKKKDRMNDTTDSGTHVRTERMIAGYRIGFDDETVEEIYDEYAFGARNQTDRTDISEIAACGADTNDIIRPYIMARILNISKMIPLMRTVDEGEIILHVTDPVIAENNGMFLWRYGDTCSLEKIYEENMDFSNVITVGIGELASHIFGCRRTAGLPKMRVKKGVFINDYV